MQPRSCVLSMQRALSVVSLVMQPCVQTAGAQVQLGGKLVGGAPAPFLLQSGGHCPSVIGTAAAEEVLDSTSSSPAAVWLSSQSCA